ncbi:hypothetical protein CCACVL1_21647, partial [Corchorus capsularis]
LNKSRAEGVGGELWAISTFAAAVTV